MKVRCPDRPVTIPGPWLTAPGSVVRCCSGAVAGEQSRAVVGGVAGAVLVAVAGDQVELSGQVVGAGTLVGVAGADDGASRLEPTS